MARAAAYAIKPELYDQVFPSPDGNYVLKATVKSFFTLIDPFAGVSYKLSVVDKNNSILIHEDGGYSITDLTGNECLEWSPDSRYVFLKQSYRHYYTTISVFSMESNEFFDLPGETQIEELVGENLSLYDSELGSELSYFHFAIEEWYNDDIIRVSIELSNNAGRYLEAGYYQYNLADQQIMDIQIYK